MFFYYHYCWCCHCSHCYRCDHCHYHRNRHHHHHHQESTEGIAPPPWPAPLARPWPSPWFFGFRVDRVPGCHLAWNAPLVPFLNFPASSHGRAILWEPAVPRSPSVWGARARSGATASLLCCAILWCLFSVSFFFFSFLPFVFCWLTFFSSFWLVYHVWISGFSWAISFSCSKNEFLLHIIYHFTPAF